MIAKRVIDNLVSEVVQGEMSVVVHSSKQENNNELGSLKNNLYQVNIESKGDQIEVTDRGTEYYKNLREYFG